MRGARIRLAGAARLVQVFIGAVPLLNRRRRSAIGMDPGRAEPAQPCSRKQVDGRAGLKAIHGRKK